MDMDGLNAVTVFVSFAFIVTGFIGLTSITAMFNRSEGILFLMAGIAVLFVSYYRSRKQEQNTN